MTFADLQELVSDEEDAGCSILLPDSVWTARPVLDHIRQAAHSRTRSADVVLHGVLTRIAGAIPHTVKLPAIVGAQAPLCYFAAAVGPPASGKSSAYSIAAELVPVDGFHVADRLPIGSGEGLVEVLFDAVKEIDPDTNKTVTVKRQIRFNANVYIDEGEALSALGTRQGSTALATLRSIWSGQTLGQTNASTERKRVVPAGLYTYGLMLGLQPTKAAALLDDVAAGTPQRFGWAWAIDPNIPDELPPWPGVLGLVLPSVGDIERIKRLSKGYVTHEMAVAPAVIEEVRCRNRAISRGEVEVDPQDSHLDLLWLKVAALLAILDERIAVSEEDWELAGMVTRTSGTVRRHVQDIVHTEATERERQTSDRLARRQVAATTAVEDDRVEKVAHRVVKVVRDLGGEASAKAVQQRLSKLQRRVHQEAVAFAVDHGWITEVDEPGQGDDKRTLRLMDRTQGGSVNNRRLANKGLRPKKNTKPESQITSADYPID